MKDIDLLNEFKNYSPGYIVEIYNNGDTREYIYGNKAIYPNVEKVTRNTLYDIASLTKVYTATLIYIAYEEKLIDLNDTIYNLDNKFINLKDIKVIDLLSHNQNIWTDGYLGSVNSREEFYNILYTAYVKEKIPTYVDVHYIILGVILEKLYGKNYKELCIEKILNKLKLNNTFFDPPANMSASNNYEHMEDKIVDNIYPGLTHDTKGRVAKEFGIYLGHASIFTTGEDLLKFLKSFFDYSLLKKETIDLMLKHRNINDLNYKKLKKLYNKEDINEMYNMTLKDNSELHLSKPINNMGVVYKNIIDKLNDIPIMASDNSITFSGYTGPMFTIDFEKNIIVVIMCNAIHNSYYNRKERKEIEVKLSNRVFNSIFK